MAVRVLIGVALVVLVATPARSADPDDVAEEVADTGVYVEPGVSVTEDHVGDLVATMRDEGERASIVVLLEEPVAGGTSFADAVFDRLGEGMIVLLTPGSLGVAGVTELYTPEEVEAAVDVALGGGGSDAVILETFVSQLTGVDDSAPGDDGGVQPEAGDGGSGGLLLLVVVVGGGVALYLWWRSRRKSAGRRLDPRIAEAKAAVQGQIDAVANDIIDLEDEVRVSDDARAREFYNAAGATYNEVTAAYPSADTPEALLMLANRLDEAIWQLDSAEALLDGKPAPEKPEPQELPAPENADTGIPLPPDHAGTGGGALPPRPEYDRRDSRRSSYGGGGLMDMLVGMAGAMMGGRMATRSPGGRRAPSPTYPKIDLGSPSSSRPRRAGTGRVRTGGRRR